MDHDTHMELCCHPLFHSLLSSLALGTHIDKFYHPLSQALQVSVRYVPTHPVYDHFHSILTLSSPALKHGSSTFLTLLCAAPTLSTGPLCERMALQPVCTPTGITASALSLSVSLYLYPSACLRVCLFSTNAEQ